MSSRAMPAGVDVDIFAEWRNLLRPLMSSTPEPLLESLGRIASTCNAILRSPYSLISVLDDAGARQFFDPAEVNAAAAAALRDVARDHRVHAAVVERAEAVRLPGVDCLGEALMPHRSVLGSVLAVPIVYEGRTVGALFVGRPPGNRVHSPADESLAELVAAAAAAVLRRARLAQDFQWQQRWLHESAQLTRSVLAGEPSDPLRLFVERLQEMTSAGVVAVVRQPPADPTATLVQAAGPIAAYLDGQSVDVSSALLVPLAGQVLQHAALALFPRANGQPFTPAEVTATTMLAEQLGIALDLARGRADRERLALLDERDRIARDLHDHVIQRLFAIGLSVQSAATQLDGAAAERLLSGVDDLDETIEQIRSTIYRLRGPVLPAPLSVAAKVAELAHEMEPVLGFSVDLEIRGPLEFGVDDEVCDDCVAVLREALTNVARHANASHVQVALTANTSKLTLSVTDDGRGVGGARRRSGLANMRARAERRQGLMSVDSPDGGGTWLTWTIPLGG